MNKTLTTQDRINRETYPPTIAYLKGCKAFEDGVELKAVNNPYSVFDFHNQTSLANEWERGYKVSRKHSRFNATIAARKSK